jgi:hypothetical protein
LADRPGGCRGYPGARGVTGLRRFSANAAVTDFGCFSAYAAVTMVVAKSAESVAL